VKIRPTVLVAQVEDRNSVVPRAEQALIASTARSLRAKAGVL
jgi:hypothetical protein